MGVTATARPWKWQDVLLVACVALAVYANAVPGGFVFDDKLIQSDTRIRDFDVVTIFTTDYWGNYQGTTGDLYRPITIFSYALNAALTGLSSPWFHVVNLVLHAAVCVMLLLLIEALFANRQLALASALLFATHPIHTEAVTGIVGRAEILVTLFLFGSLYLHATRSPMWRLPERTTLAVGLGSYLLALLSKETAIVGLGLLALVDYVRLAPASKGNRQRSLPPSLRLLALYGGVTVLYLGIRWSVIGALVTQRPNRPGLLFGEPLGTHLATMFEVFAINLKLLFWPVNLSADYSYRQVPVVATVDGTVAAGIATAALLLAAFVWAFRRRELPLVFAFGFFAISYSIVSNVVPIGVLVAERLLYLPSVGFCCALAWIGIRLSQWLGSVSAFPLLQRLPAALLAGLLIAYGVRTTVRNLDWRDAETLYRATTEASPECQAAHFNYSAMLLKRGDRESDEAALDYLKRAMAIRDDHFPSWVNLSNVYLRLGRPGDARTAAQEGAQRWPKSRKFKTLLQAAEAQIRTGAIE